MLGERVYRPNHLFRGTPVANGDELDFAYDVGFSGSMTYRFEDTLSPIAVPEPRRTQLGRHGSLPVRRLGARPPQPSESALKPFRVAAPSRALGRPLRPVGARPCGSSGAGTSRQPSVKWVAPRLGPAFHRKLLGTFQALVEPSFASVQPHRSGHPSERPKSHLNLGRSRVDCIRVNAWEIMPALLMVLFCIALSIGTVTVMLVLRRARARRPT